MPKAIVKGPGFEKKYQERLGYRGLNVINGVAPNGKLPRVIGSGIFGYEGQKDGIFGNDGTIPPGQNTGIFYNDTANYNYEVAQPDMQWNLLRRPGRPLYPGSSSRGIVLVGPSMGYAPVLSQLYYASAAARLAMGAAAGLALWWIYNNYIKAEGV
jgi:hypothetical protein